MCTRLTVENSYKYRCFSPLSISSFLQSQGSLTSTDDKSLDPPWSLSYCLFGRCPTISFKSLHIIGPSVSFSFSFIRRCTLQRLFDERSVVMTYSIYFTINMFCRIIDRVVTSISNKSKRCYFKIYL